MSWPRPCGSRGSGEGNRPRPSHTCAELVRCRSRRGCRPHALSCLTAGMLTAVPTQISAPTSGRGQCPLVTVGIRTIAGGDRAVPNLAPRTPGSSVRQHGEPPGTGSTSRRSAPHAGCASDRMVHRGSADAQARACDRGSHADAAAGPFTAPACERRAGVRGHRDAAEGRGGQRATPRPPAASLPDPAVAGWRAALRRLTRQRRAHSPKRLKPPPTPRRPGGAPHACLSRRHPSAAGIRQPSARHVPTARRCRRRPSPDSPPCPAVRGCGRGARVTAAASDPCGGGPAPHGQRARRHGSGAAMGGRASLGHRRRCPFGDRVGCCGTPGAASCALGLGGGGCPQGPVPSDSRDHDEPYDIRARHRHGGTLGTHATRGRGTDARRAHPCHQSPYARRPAGLWGTGHGTGAWRGRSHPPACPRPVRGPRQRTLMAGGLCQWLSAVLRSCAPIRHPLPAPGRRHATRRGDDHQRL